MKVEKIIMSQEREVTLTAYIQEVGGEFGFEQRPAILILPGGGYAMCSDREADPVALAYAKVGYHTFILRYTVKSKGLWPQPLEDYEEAVQLLIEKADEWAIDMDNLAVVGFSAGGHLAACTATVATRKPKAAILVYPAILKEICDLCQPNMPYPHEHVDSETSPCFLVSARDDRVVDVSNTLIMALALANNRIAFESHIYSFGDHGFSTGESYLETVPLSERVPNWVADSIGWLQEIMGEFTSNGMVKSAQGPHLTANHGEVLSVDCSLGHLLAQGQTVQNHLTDLLEAIKSYAVKKGVSYEGLLKIVSNFNVRDLLVMLQFEDDQIEDLIKNLTQEINR